MQSVKQLFRILAIIPKCGYYYLVIRRLIKDAIMSHRSYPCVREVSGFISKWIFGNKAGFFISQPKEIERVVCRFVSIQPILEYSSSLPGGSLCPNYFPLSH